MLGPHFQNRLYFYVLLCQLFIERIETFKIVRTVTAIRGELGIAAVAGDLRGDAHPQNMGSVRVGDDPVVSVRVAVDKTGRQRPALSVHFCLGRPQVLADGRDLAVQNSQVGDVGLRTGTVKNLRVFDKQIKHGLSLRFSVQHQRLPWRGAVKKSIHNNGFF